MSLIRRLAPLALVAALLMVLGCNRNAPTDEAIKTTKVRVQLNWVPEPEFGGLYAALEKGLYRDAGLEVEIIKGSAGVPSAQLAASGRVEMGVVTGEEVVKLRSSGGELVAVYAQFKTSPRAIVVHGASPYKSLEALWKSDSTVVYEPGQTFARWLNHKYGGAALKSVPSTGNLAGFIADTSLAQAVYIFSEPVELQRRKVPVRVMAVADTGFNPYEAVLATNAEFLETNRATVEKFVAATRAGWKAYLAEPGPINAIMAELNPAMSKEAMDISVKLALPYIQGQGGELGQMTEARWAALVDQMVTLGAMPADKAPATSALFVDL